MEYLTMDRRGKDLNKLCRWGRRTKNQRLKENEGVEAGRLLEEQNPHQMTADRQIS